MKKQLLFVKIDDKGTGTVEVPKTYQEIEALLPTDELKEALAEYVLGEDEGEPEKIWETKDNANQRAILVTLEGEHIGAKWPDGSKTEVALAAIVDHYQKLQAEEEAAKATESKKSEAKTEQPAPETETEPAKEDKTPAKMANVNQEVASATDVANLKQIVTRLVEQNQLTAEVQENIVNALQGLQKMTGNQLKMAQEIGQMLEKVAATLPAETEA